MKDLRFIDPTHREGLNMTVRRGIKWNLEDMAMVEGLGARYIETAVYKYKDIPYCFINKHHSGLDNRGLFSAMLDAYDGFNKDEIVTVVMYNSEAE